MKKSIVILITCIVSILCLTACGCKHDWQEATCTAPKTCTICSETEGEVLEHEWLAATCTEPKTCIVCKATEGELLEHEWLAATCTEPRTCYVCKATEGEALGHAWKEATCTEAKICLTCNMEEGVSLGHTLTEKEETKAPTCTESGMAEGICTNCNKKLSEEIPALAHSPGEWVITIEATYDNVGKESVSCTVCNNMLEEREYELTEEEKENWYKNACGDFNYRDIARSAEKYLGKRIKFTGEVGAIFKEAEKGEGESIYYVYTGDSYGMYTDAPFYVFVDSSNERILEEDIITFYGEVGELYNDFAGKQPRLNAVYYDIHLDS